MIEFIENSEIEESWYNFATEDENSIFSQQFPLFFTLRNNQKFYKELDPQYVDLAKKLSIQKNEDVMDAIMQLMYQDKFKEIVGLPKYLQVIDINTMIDENIFVNPKDEDWSTLLVSFSMKILREHCSKFGIKAATTKLETINRLLEVSLNEEIDQKRYFKLNPSIQNIHIQFGQFCKNIVQEEFEKNPLRIKSIEEKLDAEELGESIESSVYTIRNYGFSSIIYLKNREPLFRILGVSIKSGDNDVLLFENGKIAITETVYLDKWQSKRISIIDESGSVLAYFIVGDIDYYKLTVMEDRPIVFLALTDEKYWVLNYESLEEQYYDNPDNLDIYSIIDRK